MQVFAVVVVVVIMRVVESVIHAALRSAAINKYLA